MSSDMTETSDALAHSPADTPVADAPVADASGADAASGHGYAPRKDEYLKRLRRVEGQVRGISRMVDEDQYCIDVLTQVAAATKALHAVSLGLLEDHLGHCVADAARQSRDTGDDAVVQDKIAEATAAIARLVR